MKNLLYTIIICASLLSLLTITYGCGSKEVKGTNDSVLTVPYIVNVSIAEPERALALIDTAEQQGLMNDFDLNRLRAVVYHNGFSDNIKSLEYSLKAYNSPEARDKAQAFLRVIEMIANQYYLNGDYPQSIRFCTEGIKLAQDSLIKVSEAKLNFKIGRNLMFLNRKDEAFGYYWKAVDILDKESEKDASWETADDYVYTLAILIGTLRNEEYFDKATGLLPRYEEAVKRLETKEQLPDGIVDMRKASGYGMAAVLYAIKGENDAADEQYRKLLSTEYAETPDAGQLIIPYLYQTGDYRGALRHLQEEKKFWQANADTVSYSYVENHLESELAVYEELGDLRSANRILHTIQALNDTLRERDRNEKALELAEIYKTQEQAIEIERQSASIIVRNVIIAAAVVFLLLCILFIARILRYNRTISTKNKAMVNTIDELMAYKDRAFEQQEEIIGLRGQLQIMSAEHTSEGNGADIPPAVQAADEDAAVSESALNEFDRKLFERMNHEILARRLFLNPDFSKTSLSAEFSIPAYKFSAFFKEYAGCSFSQYVHNCRLDYAVKLIKENPSWSLEAIAQAAQMSNSSFYNQFKKKFGMSPSDFRSGEASTGPGKD